MTHSKVVGMIITNQKSILGGVEDKLLIVRSTKINFTQISYENKNKFSI
jgi:hypothetical protein